MDSKHAKILTQRILSLKLLKDYEHAFSETTRMPLSFHAVESGKDVQHRKKYENPFCVLLGKSERGCPGCRENQQKISRRAAKTQNNVCFAGLTDSAVPVRVGDQVLGFLHTGQVALHKPEPRKFKEIAAKLVHWGMTANLRKLEDAYLRTPVMKPESYQARVRLLEVFCQHLALIVDQMVLDEEDAGPSVIKKAKQLVKMRQKEDISTRDVAKILNMSTFCFCKLFKKTTGMTFTDYLVHVRVSKAKSLLRNPKLRISEIAYDIGYGLPASFNRTFQRIVGQTPGDYRKAALKGLL